MKTLLDTSVLISPRTAEFPGEVAISTATLAELHFGVLVTHDPSIRAQRLELLTRVQQRFQALPLDADVAASYGRVAAATVRAGRQPRRRQLDLVIAATALAHRARLATANVADVAHLADLIDIVDTAEGRPG